MPTVASRQLLRREEELCLARRLRLLHLHRQPEGGPNWNLASFHHSVDSVGCSLVGADVRSDSQLRVHIAEASGLTPVANVLAAQCCLEMLRRTGEADLIESNRDFFDPGWGEPAMIAAGNLRFEADGSNWCGSFAGLKPPISVEAEGRVELLRGAGPFLGLTETTFPILRRRLEPHARLLILAGSGAAEHSTELLDMLSRQTRSPIRAWVDELGSRLARDLEPGLSLLLLGIERVD